MAKSIMCCRKESHTWHSAQPWPDCEDPACSKNRQQSVMSGRLQKCGCVWVCVCVFAVAHAFMPIWSREMESSCFCRFNPSTAWSDESQKWSDAQTNTPTYKHQSPLSFYTQIELPLIFLFCRVIYCTHKCVDTHTHTQARTHTHII